MARVRLAVDDEVRHVRGKVEEAEEVERTARLEAIIFGGLQNVNRARWLKSSGQEAEARQVLAVLETILINNLHQRSMRQLSMNALKRSKHGV